MVAAWWRSASPVTCWHRVAGKARCDCGNCRRAGRSVTGIAHDDSVNGIAFLDADREIVTAGYDGVLARRAIDGQLLEQVETPAAITHMVADSGTDRLLTGHADGSVRLWRATDFTLLQEQQLHRGAVKAVAIAPGCRTLCLQQ